MTDDSGATRTVVRVSVTPAPDSEAAEYEYELRGPESELLAWQPWTTTSDLAPVVPGAGADEAVSVRARAAAGTRRSAWVYATTLPPQIQPQYRYRATTGAAPDTPRSSDAQRADDGYVPAGWSATVLAATRARPAVWRTRRRGVPGAWSDFDAPVMVDVHGGRDAVLAGDGDPNGPPPVDADTGVLYVQGDGTVWVRAADRWVRLLDLTPDPGSTIHTGDVAPGDVPPGDIPGLVDGDVYVATDGRWWVRSGNWVSRGDLTGPAGPPGLPGASTILAYDDLQTTGAVGVGGSYQFLRIGENGQNDWSLLTSGSVDHLQLAATDSAGISQATILRQIVPGDVIVWYASRHRWIEFRVEATSVTGSVHLFRVAYVEHDDADGDHAIPTAAGNRVQFRLSRAAAGEPGAPGDPGIRIRGAWSASETYNTGDVVSVEVMIDLGGLPGGVGGPVSWTMLLIATTDGLIGTPPNNVFAPAAGWVWFSGPPGAPT